MTFEKWLKIAYKVCRNFNKNYTMVNFIKEGTTLLFIAFDKTQYLCGYSA